MAKTSQILEYHLGKGNFGPYLHQRTVTDFARDVVGILQSPNGDATYIVRVGPIPEVSSISTTQHGLPTPPPEILVPHETRRFWGSRPRCWRGIAIDTGERDLDNRTEKMTMVPRSSISEPSDLHNLWSSICHVIYFVHLNVPMDVFHKFIPQTAFPQFENDCKHWVEAQQRRLQNYCLVEGPKIVFEKEIKSGRFPEADAQVRSQLWTDVFQNGFVETFSRLGRSVGLRTISRMDPSDPLARYARYLFTSVLEVAWKKRQNMITKTTATSAFRNLADDVPINIRITVEDVVLPEALGRAHKSARNV